MPTKYRSKPVLIEAIQLTPDSREEIIKWIGNKWINRDQFDPINLHIDGQHGTVVVEPGCWVIKGSNKEFYPCDNATFIEKYEVANAKG